MADTSIEWTRNADGSKGKSWNPIRARRKSTGKVGHYCQKISPGCANCYAAAMNQRCTSDGLRGIGNGIPYAVDKLDQVEMFLDEKVLLAPLRWRKPTRIFVCSMTDLFGTWVDDEWITQVYAVAALCPQHTFIVLTKRPERRLSWYRGLDEEGGEGFRDAVVEGTAQSIYAKLHPDETRVEEWLAVNLPLPNVWELVTVCNQEEADRLIPILLQTPAAVRSISYEPALGPVDIGRVPLRGLQWVVCGGESGPKARPMPASWARSMRDECIRAEIPFFFKQWGSGKEMGSGLPGHPSYGSGRSSAPKGGRLLDGREWNEFPETKA